MDIEVGTTVTHASGWQGKVVDIDGELWGNRVLVVEHDGRTARWLETVFTTSKEEGPE